MKEFVMKYKVWCLIPLVAILIAGGWYVSSTQWTRDFDLKYVDYVGESEAGNYSGSAYYLYEITNDTHHTLKNVSVVVSVEDILPGDWKYEDYVVSSIRPGETVEYRLYRNDCEEAAEKQGESAYMVTSLEIVKIKYSK